MDLSIIISLIALIGTAFTYFIHDQKLKRQERLINEYQLEKIQVEKVEQQKAAVKARFVREGNKTKIKIYNDGIAKARNINLITDAIDDIFVLMDGIFPYKYLNSGESIEVIVISSESSIDKLEVKLVWDDDFIQGNQYDQILQIR